MAQSISDIIEIARRSRKHQHAEFEIDDLSRELKAGKFSKSVFADFVPIRLVTLLEASVRGCVAEVVDSGEPYITAAAALAGRLPGRAMSDAILAVSRKDLTLGTLVSHTFTVGGVTEMMSVLETILGPAIKQELIEIEPRWIEPENKEEIIIANIDTTFGVLERLFSVRHALVHERPRNSPYEHGELVGFIDHTRQFVTAISWVVIHRLYDRVPYTQTEMNIQAGKEAERVQDELNELRGGAPGAFASPSTEEAETEFHWDRFVDLSAKRYAGYMDEGWPGTIAPLLYSEHRKMLNQWRLGLLKKGARWNPVGDAE